MADDWYGSGRRPRDPEQDRGFRQAREQYRPRDAEGSEDFPAERRAGGQGRHERGRGEFWPRDREAVRKREMRRDYGREFPEDRHDPDPDHYEGRDVWPKYRDETSPHGRPRRSFGNGGETGWPRSSEGAWHSGQEPTANHRGRGPRGYTRSDSRILEDVNDRLTEDPFLDASDIEVAVEGGEVTLSGTVESRHAKRRAEDDVEDVAGVKHCQNNLRVRSRPPASGTGEPTA